MSALRQKFGASHLLHIRGLIMAYWKEVPMSNTYPRGQRSWYWQRSLPFGLGKVHSSSLLLGKSSVLHQMPAGTEIESGHSPNQSSVAKTDHSASYWPILDGCKLPSEAMILCSHAWSKGSAAWTWDKSSGMKNRTQSWDPTGAWVWVDRWPGLTWGFADSCSRIGTWAPEQR